MQRLQEGMMPGFVGPVGVGEVPVVISILGDAAGFGEGAGGAWPSGTFCAAGSGVAGSGDTPTQTL